MELPHIGQNCSVTSCNQLDFLPFVCNSCGLSFCGEHKTRENHGCTGPEHSSRPEYTGVRSYPCCVSGCDRKELSPLTCHHCSSDFCLDHRLQEDHKCVALTPQRPEVTRTGQHVQDLLAHRVPQTRPAKKLTNPKSIAMAAKVNLMKLKARAVGDQGVPQTERVFFTVCLPHSSGKPAQALFFSKVWTVGRVIDVIADRASITNVNNTDAGQKLRLFHGETGDLLPVDQSLCQVMSDETVHLHSGATLILESVGDPVTAIHDVTVYKK